MLLLAHPLALALAAAALLACCGCVGGKLCRARRRRRLASRHESRQDRCQEIARQFRAVAEETRQVKRE